MAATSIKLQPGHGYRAFRKDQSEVGLVEGRNITIEYRWADLVSRQVTVILARPRFCSQPNRQKTRLTKSASQIRHSEGY